MILTWFCLSLTLALARLVITLPWPTRERTEDIYFHAGVSMHGENPGGQAVPYRMLELEAKGMEDIYSLSRPRAHPMRGAACMVRTPEDRQVPIGGWGWRPKGSVVMALRLRGQLSPS